jgi:polyisoprenoid-binding protein YceI
MIALPMFLALAQTADAARYAFDDTRGEITFGLVASLHDISGKAGSFTGELDIGSESPTGKVVLQAAQLTTFLSVRDDRMHDFCLSTDEYPTIELRIGATTGNVKGLNSGKGSGTIELRGQLTVRSSSRDVVIPMTYTWENGGVRLVGSHQLKWTDYGVPDPSILISTLYPEVNVQFNVLLQQAP